MQVPLIPAPPAPVKATTNNLQRYFKVAFTRPSATNANVRQRSVWYAHFDGEWIARQMEIHADREPLLLIAGKNIILFYFVLFYFVLFYIIYLFIYLFIF